MIGPLQVLIGLVLMLGLMFLGLHVGTVTHANVGAQIAALVEAWGWSPDDHLLLVLPLHHVHGIINGLGSALETERRLYELSMATEDRVEGMDAFLDKRTPEFRGR